MSTVHLRTAAPLAFSLLLAPAIALATPPQGAADSSSPSTGNGMLPVSAFARHATVSSPRLSPDGKHLLVRMDGKTGKEHALVVYDLADMSITSELRMPVYEIPVDPVWVSNTWIALEIGKKYGSLDRPVNTGQVIATRIDGKRQHTLYGWDPATLDARARSRGSDQGLGFITQLPQDPNNHVYIRTQPFGRENRSTLYDMDAAHNTRHLIANMHVAGMSFLLDPKGQAAFAFGTNADFDYVAYRRAGQGWRQLKLHDDYGDFFHPIAYAPDHQHIYAEVGKHGGPYALVEEPLDGSQQKVLARNEFASVGDIQWTPTPEQPFAAFAHDGVPKPIFIQPNLPAAKLYRALQKAFSGEVIDFINFSHDGGKLLFYASSDRDPGTYYLIDTHTDKVRKLFAVAPWIHPAQMAARSTFHFTTSDGKTLEGILTFPPQRQQQDLPMVLVPHGGPQSHDSWFFDEDAQFLANRGYLVLQVNFRGSDGRGNAFQRAGDLKWGTRIQQDLIDGVKWAIAHHLGDAKRICVYGGSFGGYSALMQVIRAPHLYQCAIGYAGVYDLRMMYKKGDVPTSKSGRSYLHTVIGKNDADLDANSPDKLADKIDVPVLLVHGKDDQRAPFNQAKAMRAALEAAHKPYQWMAVNGEGHGFFTEAHRAAFLTRMQKFLEKNIGPGAPMQAPQASR